MCIVQVGNPNTDFVTAFVSVFCADISLYNNILIDMSSNTLKHCYFQRQNCTFHVILRSSICQQIAGVLMLNLVFTVGVL